MVIRLGMAALAMLFPALTVAAHATPAACLERLLPPSAGAATGQRELSARDLVELRDFGDSSVSPDGRWAALILRRADADRDVYCIGVVLVPLSGAGAPRLIDTGGDLLMVRSDLRGVADITNGSPLGNAPLWSPDSRSIAYLRRDRGVTQVWIASTDGRPRQLTSLSEDARAVEWTSSTTVSIRLRSSRAAIAAIEQDGRSGYLYDRRFWALSEARPNPPASPLNTITLDTSTGKPSPNPRPSSERGRPASARLFVRLGEGALAWTEPEAPPRYAGPSVLVTEAVGRRRTCGEPCSARIAGLWALGSNELLFLRGGSADNGGRTELYRWQLARGEPERILATDDALSSCALAGVRLICGRETARHPRSLIAIDSANGAITTLYDPNPELAGRIRSRVERLRWTASDGVSSYGDLVLPPDHRPGQRHPLIIVQYSSDGFLRGGVGDEYPIHLFAAHGFAVLSVTRPPAPARDSKAADADSYQRINVQSWADRRRVLASLEAGIDTVLKRDVVDPARIGITGLSDGSSTVQFALLNSRRFAAAAISTCCESAGSLASVGLAYSDTTTKWGYPPPGTEDPAFWKPYSLAANAARVRTPLLIQVADREFRLALETYAALDHAQAPVEMYVFPDEHHVKSHPEHRLAIYARNLAWFDFWLNGAVPANPESEETMKRWRALKLRVAP